MLRQVRAVTVSSVGLCCVELRRGSFGTAVRGTFRSGLAVMFCYGRLGKERQAMAVKACSGEFRYGDVRSVEAVMVSSGKLR